MAQSRIFPNIGVDDLKFGMPRSGVRELLSAPFEPFKRAPSSEFCDWFSSLGIFCHYSKTGLLEAVEFTSPANPSWEGVNLLSLNFSHAKSLLETKDETIRIEKDSVTSILFGIGVWAPLAKEVPTALCESIIAFEPGYYTNTNFR